MTIDLDDLLSLTRTIMPVAQGLVVVGVCVLLWAIPYSVAVTILRLTPRDPVRFFPYVVKQRLIRQAHGRCEHKPLLWKRCSRPGKEADHIRPWSRGGRTEFRNGQLLCHRCNHKKGARLPGPLYRWRLQRRRLNY